jgi:hypothetical protein
LWLKYGVRLAKIRASSHRKNKFARNDDLLRIGVDNVEGAGI